MSFVQRLLKASFTLAGGSSGGPTTFDNGTNNTATLPGLRMSAKIVKGGGRAWGQMDLKIYGMTASLMRQLSTLGVKINMPQRSSVTLQAGDAQSGMTTVFVGNVMNAWGDFNSSPDVPFNVDAKVGGFLAVQNVAPASYSGSTDVASAMASLAATANLKFVNSGVSGKIAAPYLWGSPLQQMQQIADAAGIIYTVDIDTLYIWKKNGQRGSSGVVISPSTGMIGYPSFTNQGIMVKTIYNPSIGIGQTVQVQSTVDAVSPANGTWAVMNFDLDLESQVLHGQWSQTLYCYNPKFPFPLL